MAKEGLAHKIQPEEAPHVQPEHDGSGLLVEKMHRKKKEKLSKKERQAKEREKREKAQAEKREARAEQSRQSRGITALDEQMEEYRKEGEKQRKAFEKELATKEALRKQGPSEERKKELETLKERITEGKTPDEDIAIKKIQEKFGKKPTTLETPSPKTPTTPFPEMIEERKLQYTTERSKKPSIFKALFSKEARDQRAYMKYGQMSADEPIAKEPTDKFAKADAQQAAYEEKTSAPKLGEVDTTPWDKDEEEKPKKKGLFARWRNR